MIYFDQELCESQTQNRYWNMLPGTAVLLATLMGGNKSPSQLRWRTTDHDTSGLHGKNTTVSNHDLSLNEKTCIVPSSDVSLGAFKKTTSRRSKVEEIGTSKSASAQNVQRMPTAKTRRGIGHSSERLRRDVKSKRDSTQTWQSPSEKYPVTEDVSDVFVKVMESEAEFMKNLAKRNAIAPHAAFERLNETPVQQLPSLDALTFVLGHDAITTESLSQAFDRDLSEIQSTLACASFPPHTTPVLHHQEEEKQKKKRRISETKNDLNGNPKADAQEQSFSFQSVFSTFENFDDDIYTDSEEDIEQRSLRFPPFIRPLRRVLRSLKQREYLYQQFGEKSLSLQIKNRCGSDVKNSVLFLKSNKYRKRQEWREWDKAARLALWFNSWRPVALKSLSRDRIKAGLVTAQQLDTLNKLNIFQRRLELPEFKLSQCLLVYFTKHMPYVRDTEALKNLKESFNVLNRMPCIRSAFQWTVWNSGRTLSKHCFKEHKQRMPYSIQWCTPGVRFYVGRAETIWGSPTNIGYQKITYPMEFIFWINRSTKPFVALEPVFMSPQHISNEVPCTMDFQEDDADALTGALALHVENPSDMTVQVVHEEDSSESSSDSQLCLSPPFEKAFTHLSDMDTTHSNFSASGVFERMSSRWSARKRCRKRCGEGSCTTGTGCISSTVHPWPDEDQSEDSCMEYIESQSCYRSLRRATRARLEEQRQFVEKTLNDGSSRSCDKKKAKRLCTLFEHGLEPMEPKFVHPCSCRTSKGSLFCVGHKEIGEKDPTPVEENINREERWTYMLHKKPRVRGLEPAPYFESRVPLAFFSKTTDVTGNKFHFLAVDQNEVWRQYGDSKAYPKRLGKYADLIKGSREYYAVIDEHKKNVTIVPGSSLSLFWYRTPKQNLLDMHWLAFWKKWSLARFRHRLIRKLFRYQYLQKQGWFIWKQKLDRLAKIEDRIREASAFRKAKQTRLTTSYFSSYPPFPPCNAQQEGKQGTAYTVNDMLKKFDEWETDRHLDTSRTVKLEDQVHGHRESEWESKPTVEPTQEWEDTQVTTVIEQGRVEQEATGLAATLLPCTLSTEEEQKYYSCLYNESLHSKTIPYWAWGWSKGVRKRIAQGLSKCYGPIISHYYRKTLPAFTATYHMARKVMGEKLQAELDYMEQRKYMQQRQQAQDPGSNVDEHSGTPSTNIYTQQLSGALATLEGKHDSFD